MNVENMRIAIQFFRDLNKSHQKVNNSLLSMYTNSQGVSGLWNMSTWGVTNDHWSFAPELFNQLDEKGQGGKIKEVTEWLNQHSCGTANCALGWIGISGVFPDASYTSESMSTVPFEYKGERVSPSMFAKRLLGLNVHQFSELFCNLGYKNPQEIAYRMEKMLHEHERGIS